MIGDVSTSINITLGFDNDHVYFPTNTGVPFHDSLDAVSSRVPDPAEDFTLLTGRTDTVGDVSGLGDEVSINGPDLTILCKERLEALAKRSCNHTVL